jgi:ribonucleoside-triphosphate reductase
MLPQIDMSQFITNSPSFPEPNWGPSGKDVYERTYQRVKPNGDKETWHDTVTRVVKGNLSLVPGDRIAEGEEKELYDLIYNFRGIPAGRHLWMSGVEGRQFLFNCYVSGWGPNLADHFAFTFNQLMEGGGVGANYSTKHLQHYTIFNLVNVHIVCDPAHPDYEKLAEAGLLSNLYSPEYEGAWEVEDSREGWVFALTEVINKATEWEPKGFPQDKQTGEYLVDLVYDVTNIREAGRRIKTFGGTSAGPVPFAKMIKDIGHLLNDGWLNGVSGPLCMDMDHVIATCVVSGNVRRSARMSIMHWNDPWIDWFLTCKESGLGHWSTNISVEIDDEFIDLINYGEGSTYTVNVDRLEKARKVYQAIVEGMLRNGEPGIWNSSLSNVGEPNLVIATNPCGEITLEPWENCNLGHINLDAFVRTDGSVDFDGLERAHWLMARFLIRATYGDITDPKTRSVVLRNRRIGVGHFGFAGYVAKQGIRYSQSYKVPSVIMMLSDMKQVVSKAVTEYAHELRIPVPVKSTTVAPTGTIAKLAGRTEGIHPVFARCFIRRIRFSTVDADQNAKIEDYRAKGYNVVPDPSVPNTMVVEIPTLESLVAELEAMGIDPSILEDASEISFEDFLNVQYMYQKYWADNAVSYTINVRPERYNVPEVMGILRPFLGRLKGTTVFPERGYELAPYERVTEAEFALLRGSQAVSDSVDDDCANGACPVR